MKLLVLAAATGVMLASSAAAQLKSSMAGALPSCFRTRDMLGHRVDGDRTLYISVAGPAIYRVRMKNPCLAASTSYEPLMLRDPTGAGRICHPLDFDVSIHSIHCTVDSIAKLTPDEVAALPSRVKP